MKSRLPAFLLALALCLSLAPSAAAYTEIEDIKDDLANVDIVQFCNGNESENYTHNYATDGDEVTIEYKPTLRMRDSMAMYLQPRQSQLLNAKFNVRVEIDTTVLEFIDTGGTLTVTFVSKFLKPWVIEAGDLSGFGGAFDDCMAVLAGGFAFDLVQYDADGWFTYNIHIRKRYRNTATLIVKTAQ